MKRSAISSTKPCSLMKTISLLNKKPRHSGS